jgi:predicted transcriptional regulator
MQTPGPNGAENTKESLSDIILKYIREHPGIHFNDLHRDLNLAPGTLQYHLNRMESSGKVLVIRMEYKTLYFPPGMSDPMDQKILTMLRQQIPRKLILILLENNNRSGQELIKLLKITKSTLSYYTRRLEKLEVIKSNIQGREKFYSVINSAHVARLLMDHKKSFSDKMVDRFIELWARI